MQDQEDVADAAAEQPAEKKLKDSQADAAAKVEDERQPADVEHEPAADMEAAAAADTNPEPAAAVKEKGKDVKAEAAEGAVKEQGPADEGAGQPSACSEQTGAEQLPRYEDLQLCWRHCSCPVSGLVTLLAFCSGAEGIGPSVMPGVWPEQAWPFPSPQGSSSKRAAWLVSTRAMSGPVQPARI